LGYNQSTFENRQRSFSCKKGTIDNKKSLFIAPFFARK
jgi:hypothetical protein